MASYWFRNVWAVTGRTTAIFPLRVRMTTRKNKSESGTIPLDAERLAGERLDRPSIARAISECPTTRPERRGSLPWNNGSLSLGQWTPEFKLRIAIVPESKNRSVWKSIWKVVTISGGALTLLGYGFNGLAYSTLFHPPRSWFAANVICVLVGIACLSIGQVGWIILLDKAGRARVTAFGFGFPIALALIGNLSAHGDSHGSFPIFFLPLSPLIIVAFILLWLW